MKISIEKHPKSKIELKIEVPAEKFQEFFDKAILDLGKDLEIGGFRKGKAPKEIIEKAISQETIFKKAAEEAVKESYLQAIFKNKLEPLGQPEIEVLKLAPANPFEFKAKVSVWPEIKLPDYKKIAGKVERKKVFVEEKEMAEAIKWVQKSRAKFSLKTESCQKGDFIEIEYSLTSFSSPESQNYKDAFILGEAYFIPGFEEELEEMKAGEEKEFWLDSQNLKKPLPGPKVKCKVKMNSVQKMELPEINDQFVSGFGKFENLEEFKKSLKDGLKTEKENEEKTRMRQEIIEKIAENSQSEIPGILIEREKARMLEDLKEKISQNLQAPFEDYLAQIKKTEQELLESFLTPAEKRIKNFLVLKEIWKKENIEVSEEELKEETNKELKRYPDPNEAKKIDLEELREYAKEAIKNEKTFQLLESFAKNL